MCQWCASDDTKDEANEDDGELVSAQDSSDEDDKGGTDNRDDDAKSGPTLEGFEVVNEAEVASEAASEDDRFVIAPEGIPSVNKADDSNNPLEFVASLDMVAEANWNELLRVLNNAACAQRKDNHYEWWNAVVLKLSLIAITDIST